MTDRPTLADLAAGSQGDNLGLRCPDCGCRHFHDVRAAVLRTIPLGPNQSIRRIRMCRHCGRRFNTYERITSCARTPDSDT